MGKVKEYWYSTPIVEVVDMSDTREIMTSLKSKIIKLELELHELKMIISNHLDVTIK